MTQYFEIRNAPHNGDVIAIWRKEHENHQLIFGVQDVVCAPENEDEKRTHFMNDARTVECTLMLHITEPEFSVHDEICNIPHILSDGILHHLGILEWRHEWHAFVDGFHRIDCKGTVYAKVIDLESEDVLKEKADAISSSQDTA